MNPDPCPHLDSTRHQTTLVTKSIWSVTGLCIVSNLSIAVAVDSGGTSPGVLVDMVAARSPGELAGLQPGDRLLSWERPPQPPANPIPASGTFRSPFDWMLVTLEQAPRGVVRITGERGAAIVTIELPPGEWGVVVQPLMPERVLASFRAGKAAVSAGDAEAGASLWSDALTGLAADALSRSWMNLLIADVWAGVRNWSAV